jgi:hypothetical protein
MQSEYFIKGEVIKVATMAAKGGTMRITFDVPLIDKTATLAMAQNKTVALNISFTQHKIDEAAGQMGLFEGKEPEETEENKKEFFGTE